MLTNVISEVIRFFARTLMISLLIFQVSTNVAFAGMVSTEALFEENVVQDNEQLQLRSAISKRIEGHFIEMGVDSEMAQARIERLTLTELMKVDAELDALAAGGGVGGTFALLFVIFMITDIICATDIFTFVRCVEGLAPDYQ